MSVLAKIKEFEDEAIGWRRDLHQNPETAYEEFWTSDYIADKLTKLGIEIHRGLGGTGIVGTIKNGDSDKVISLRADMDALDILEKTGLSYCSKIDGKMHGCGHDGHSIMLLAAAKYLSENKDFNGTVHLIFQPAEEGGAGAKAMINDGIFDKFPCDAIYGMHNWPGIDIGKMAIRKGGITASADRLIIKISGKGGHAAMPDNNIDVITTASTIVQSLQTIISRNIKPTNPAVLSICKFHAGTDSLNVMPDTAEIGGTIRCFSPEDRALIKERVIKIVNSTCDAFGAIAEIDFIDGYPSVMNSDIETDNAIKAAIITVGEDNVDAEFVPTTGAEDFAYFLEESKGAYIILGQREQNKTAALHSPEYDFNDNALAIGASYWVNLVESYLK